MWARERVNVALCPIPERARRRIDNVDVRRWRACRKLALELQWRNDQQHGLKDPLLSPRNLKPTEKESM